MNYKMLYNITTVSKMYTTIMVDNNACGLLFIV